MSATAQNETLNRETATAARPEVCFHHIFERQAARNPEAPALICGDEVMTYRALKQRANQLAHYLLSLGVTPETLVGI